MGHFGGTSACVAAGGAGFSRVPERLFAMESHPFRAVGRNPEFQSKNLRISGQESWGSVPSEGTPGGITVGVLYSKGAAADGAVVSHRRAKNR